MKRMLTENRVNQIISENIMLFENDMIFGRLNDNLGYLQQAYQQISSQSADNPQMTDVKQSALKYTYALCAAINRCLQAQSLNEASTFWNTMPKAQFANSVNKMQLSSMPNFLSDVGFYVPDAVKAGTRGYKKWRDWMEQWGRNYIQARERQKQAKQQQAQQGQPGGQGQGQQGQASPLSVVSQVNNQTSFQALCQLWPTLKNDIMMYSDTFDGYFAYAIENWMNIVDETFADAGLT